MSRRTSEIPRGTSYVLWFNGGNEGCDYTVSCNETLVPLKASNLDEAIEEARRFIIEDGDYYCRDESSKRVLHKGARAALLQVSRIIAFDLPAIFAEVDEAAKKKLAEQSESAERAEFERLQKKFGGK